MNKTVVTCNDYLKNDIDKLAKNLWNSLSLQLRKGIARVDFKSFSIMDETIVLTLTYLNKTSGTYHIRREDLLDHDGFVNYTGDRAVGLIDDIYQNPLSFNRILVKIMIPRFDHIKEFKSGKYLVVDNIDAYNAKVNATLNRKQIRATVVLEDILDGSSKTI